MKFSGKVGNGPLNKWLNFGGNPDHGSGSGSVCNTGKTCLGGGVHCPSAASYVCEILLTLQRHANVRINDLFPCDAMRTLWIFAFALCPSVCPSVCHNVLSVQLNIVTQTVPRDCKRSRWNSSGFTANRGPNCTQVENICDFRQITSYISVQDRDVVSIKGE